MYTITWYPYRIIIDLRRIININFTKNTPSEEVLTAHFVGLRPPRFSWERSGLSGLIGEAEGCMGHGNHGAARESIDKPAQPYIAGELLELDA